MADFTYEDHQRQAAQIAAHLVRLMNDRFRQSFIGGSLMMTAGIIALGAAKQGLIFAEIKRFDGFTDDNDPWCEHDFGAIIVVEERIFFKIDYFNRNREWCSPDPADPEVTERVKTVMLATEY